MNHMQVQSDPSFAEMATEIRVRESRKMATDIRARACLETNSTLPRNPSQFKNQRTHQKIRTKSPAKIVRHHLKNYNGTESYRQNSRRKKNGETVRFALQKSEQIYIKKMQFNIQETECRIIINIVTDKTKDFVFTTDIY